MKKIVIILGIFLAVGFVAFSFFNTNNDINSNSEKRIVNLDELSAAKAVFPSFVTLPNDEQVVGVTKAPEKYFSGIYYTIFYTTEKSPDVVIEEYKKLFISNNLTLHYPKSNSGNKFINGKASEYSLDVVVQSPTDKLNTIVGISYIKSENSDGSISF